MRSRVAGGRPARRDFLGLVAAAAAAAAGCAASAPGPAAPGRGTARTGSGSTGPAGSAGSGPVSIGTSGGRRSQPAWLLARPALASVVANQKVEAGLARSLLYELVQPGQQPLALAGARAAVVFTSAASLVTAVRSGALPAGTAAVLYDPEAWPYTPAGEQRDPVAATARAAAAAHAAGLQLIAAPGLDLTTVLAPGRTAPRSQLFLELGLAAAIAAHADVLDLQAQSMERDTAGYASFVTAAARQARREHPGVGLVAGLSTNPPGGAVRSGQLVAAIRATSGVVDGYWLNIPGPGDRCPGCQQAQPDVGIAALAAVL
jgi:hypothetical protein